MDSNLVFAFVSFFGVYFEGVNCFTVTENQFERDGSWENLILASGEQRIAAARSPIECVIICAGEDGCMSFFYVKSQQKCKLYDSVLSSTPEAVYNLGAHYYHRVCTNADVEYRTVTLSDRTVFKYRINNQTVSQPGALSSCANETCNTRLVQVLTLPKMQFLCSLLLNSSDYTALGFWIDGTNAGATDFNNITQWVTSSGVGLPTTTDFWRPGHPNSAHTDHCVLMYKKYNYFWTDRTCTEHKPYICEQF